MERKFASKLSQLKVPAAEARKQASTQLKETIQLNKFKQIEPIDFDEYVKENYAQLNQDACSRQLVLANLSNFDLNEEDIEHFSSATSSNPQHIQIGREIAKNLFLKDCLKTFTDSPSSFYSQHEAKSKINDDNDFVVNDVFKLLHQDDLNYEIDMSNEIENENSPEQLKHMKKLRKKVKRQICHEVDNEDTVDDVCDDPYQNKKEKNGWLMYKMISSIDKDINKTSFKRRYFHLRPHPNKSFDEYDATSECQSQKRIILYILECFRDVPTPSPPSNNNNNGALVASQQNNCFKHEILFDASLNQIHLKNTSNMNSNGEYSFELVETPPAQLKKKCEETIPASNSTNSANSDFSNKEIIKMHLFKADNQIQFNEWYKFLEKVISNSYSNINHGSHQSKDNLNLVCENIIEPLAQLENLFNTSLTNSMSSLSSTSSFDSIKYSSFNEDNLIAESSSNQNNIFNVYNFKQRKLMQHNSQETENDAQAWCHLLENDDEENKGPETDLNRRLLLIKCFQFNLNLNMPIISNPINISSSNSESDLNLPPNKRDSQLRQINAELFFIHLCFFDLKLGQRLSETFTWLPNYHHYFKIHNANTNKNKSKSALNLNQSSTLLFTLNGKELASSEEEADEVSTFLKENILIRVSQALLTIMDVHEEIYLVARIEKLLDGNSVRESVQPYLNQMQLQSQSSSSSNLNESSRLKASIKLNKKFTQLLKTKLSQYRQPFAWAFKSCFVKKPNSKCYEVDSDAKFHIYEQDVSHMSDDDLFKYLSDYRTKEKYLLNKLTQITNACLSFDIEISEFNSKDSKDQLLILNSSLNNLHDLSKKYKRVSTMDKKEITLNLDHFDPIIFLSPNEFALNRSPPKISTSTASTNRVSNNSKPLNRSHTLGTTHSKSLTIGPTSSMLQQRSGLSPCDQLIITSPLDLSSKNSSGYSSTSSSNNFTTNSSTNSFMHDPFYYDDFSFLNNSNNEIIKKASQIQVNNDFKNWIYVYPKSLKYDAQKSFAKARNILLKIEMRENDDFNEQTCAPLKCVYNSMDVNGKINELIRTSETDKSNELFSTTFSTLISYHTKTPQFYDEIKFLLPLNLNEKHHLLFKFYHISCTNASNTALSANVETETNTKMSENTENNIETLVGYAWLPLFKKGRILVHNQRINLAVAQTLPNQYLSYNSQTTTTNAIESTSQIKWVDNMKPIFKVNCIVNSSVHTYDPHLANFYEQCEKMKSIANDESENNIEHVISAENSNKTTILKSIDSNIKSNNKCQAPSHPQTLLYNPNKRKAPIALNNNVITRVSSPSNDDHTNNGNLNKENNDVNFSKVLNIISPTSTSSQNDITLLCNSLKALHALEITTMIKFLECLLNRILDILLSYSEISLDVPIYSIKALLHIIWQVSSSTNNKIAYLKSFVKYKFFIDYSGCKVTKLTGRTLHNEIIRTFVILFKSNHELQQDLSFIIHLIRNSWFFLLLIIKSQCLYFMQLNKNNTNPIRVLMDKNYYESLRTFFDISSQIIVTYITVNKNQKQEDIFWLKIFNKNLAYFIKKSLCILDRKFLFSVISKHLGILDGSLSNDKNKILYEMKFDFLQTICAHSNYVAFCLPINKTVLNINDFLDLKHEFHLSDQYRSVHFLSGIVLSQLCTCLNEASNREQRQRAIDLLKNLMYQHSVDKRYKNDKMKQARICALYLPLVDILINNLQRLGNFTLTSTNNTFKRKYLQEQSTQSNNHQHRLNPTPQPTPLTSSTNTSNLIAPFDSLCSASTISSSSNHITSNINNNTSDSALNNNNTASAVLGVIAGLASSSAVSSCLNNGGNGSVAISHFIDDTQSLASSIGGGENKVATNNSSTATSTLNADLILLIKQKHNSLSFASSSDAGGKGECGDDDTTTHTSSSLSNTNTNNMMLQIRRKDKLESSEIKDLLVCMIYVLSNLSDDLKLGLALINLNLNNHDSASMCCSSASNECYSDFLCLLEICLRTFKYRGKTNIKKLNVISKTTASLVSSTENASPQRQLTNNDGENIDEENDKLSLFEANMCFNVSNCVLNMLSLILVHLKDKLCNLLLKQMLNIYFYLLESNQGEEIKLKVISSIRVHLVRRNNTPQQKQSHHFSNLPLSSLCLELLKCCCFETKLITIRFEACKCIYELLKQDFACIQSHLIVSLSLLINNKETSFVKKQTLLKQSSKNLRQSLNMLKSLALKSNDKFLDNNIQLYQQTDDLTKRIQNIFEATCKMKHYTTSPSNNENDCDIDGIIDSQLTLVKSYENSLELKKTWLQSIADIHVREKNYSEAAHAYIFIAALIADYLKYRGIYTLGSSVFKKIAPNIDLDQNLITYLDDNHDRLNEDSSPQSQYTMTHLISYLNKSAEMLKLGERYDILPEIFKLAAAIHGPRDYENLKQIYQNIEITYSIMAERDKSGGTNGRDAEKSLGVYYRVCFYGRMFKDDNNKCYIYKCSPNTKLFEICEKLKRIYKRKFHESNSNGTVEILNDNRKIAELKLDFSNNKNFIQVTYVQPYFDENELENRVSFFEKNNNLRKFFFETSHYLQQQPENSDKKNPLNSNSNEQPKTNQDDILRRLCKRKNILETSHWFPYVKKRILIQYETSVELNPLETACDELKQKCDDFEQCLKRKDLTLLELYLQGGILPQVHCGPLAYAEAFLEPTDSNMKYSKQQKLKFKLIFKRLIEMYQKGIDLYGSLQHQLNQESTTANLTGKTTSYSNEMTLHRILQEKFNEFENTFRNLILIDGDMELYQELLKTSKSSLLSLGSNNTSPLTSSHA